MANFAELVLPLPLSKTLYYKIPSQYKNRIKEGMRVIVDLKNRKITGIVVGLIDKIPREFLKECKEIEEVIDEEPVVSKSILELTRRFSDYYIVPWGGIYKINSPFIFNFKNY
ncbi:hypothetical protein NLC93_00625 [Candidatus Aminicenantes bacterium AC-335-G13]|nr:hypothetical protein [Candidatus Aminicenantes bacterium AC-335-G13]